jgi:mono/diheme cytochrome c family protein
MGKVLFLSVVIAAVSTALTGAAAWAQEDDVFAFIPEGGRTLLEDIRAEGLPESLKADIAATEADPAAWNEKLTAAAAESPTIAALDEWQTDTLAHYLASNAPMDPASELPWDGRDMALKRCQSCHIITVVVTQSRTREAWLGTMHKPSHIEVPLTEAEREALADYLVINAGIPIDLVPPELRAGGASY